MADRTPTYEELERVGKALATAKWMGDDIDYIHALELQQQALTEAYNNQAEGTTHE
jgi:hypothetical protein